MTAPEPGPSSPTAPVIELDLATFSDAIAAAYAAADSYVFAIEGQTGDGYLTMSGAARRVPGGTIELTLSTAMEGVGEIDVRIVEGVWYMAYGELTGGGFLVVDPADPEGPAAGFDAVINGIDPGASVAEAEGTLVAVASVGDAELVDGVLCQPFDVTLDTTTAEGAVGGNPPAGAPARVTVRYWVDADALVHRVVMDEANGGPLSATFSGWGEPVDIQAPSADQIVELS